MKLLSAAAALAAEKANVVDFYFAQPHVNHVLSDGSEEAKATVAEVSLHLSSLTNKMKDITVAATSVEKGDNFLLFEHENQYGIVAWQDKKLRLFIEDREQKGMAVFMNAFIAYVKEGI